MAPLNTANKSPLRALWEAVVSRNNLLTLEPSWFYQPETLRPYGLLLVQWGFFFPVKNFRLIPVNKIRELVTFRKKTKAFSRILVIMSTITIVGSSLLSTELFRRIGGGNLSDSFIFIMLCILLILIPGLITLFFTRVKVKNFPLANVGAPVRSAKWQINIAIWAINFAALFFIAAQSFTRAYTPNSNQQADKNFLDLVSISPEDAANELPDISVSAISSILLQGKSLAASIAISVLKFFFAGISNLALAFLSLIVITLATESGMVFSLLFIILIGFLIGYQIFIFRKYRLT